MNIKNPIKKGLIWNSISNFSRYGLMFIGTMVLARLLTPEDYGLIGIISVFIAVGEILISAGLGGAVIKKTNANEIDFSTLTTYNLGVSIIIYLLFFFIAPIIANLYYKPIINSLIRIYSLVILIHAFAIAPQVSLTKQLRFKALSIINLTGGTCGLIIAIILAKNNYGVYSLIGQYLSQSCIVSLLLIIVSKYRFKIGFSKKCFKEQFNFGFNTTLASVLKSVSENIIGNIIAKTSTITQTGYYTQSNRLVHVPQNFFFNLIDHTFFPVLSQINNKSEFTNRIKKINERTNLTLIFLFGLSIVCCKELIYFLLGEKWMDTEWTLTILLYSGTFICLSNIGRNVLKCLGHTQQILKIEVKMFVLIMFILLIGYILGNYQFILYGYLFSCIAKSIYINFHAGKNIGLSFKDQNVSIIKMILPVSIFIIILNDISISPIILLNGVIKSIIYLILSLGYLWIVKKCNYLNI